MRLFFSRMQAACGYGGCTMSARIEDYALIGDCHTAALVSRNGSIDWLCFPRFDSGACFAALLGTPDNGRWLLVPAGEVRSSRRHYRDDTLILETDYQTDDGEVTVIDFMPVRSEKPDLVRTVVGKRGQVAMHTEIVIRFDYGSLVPWVRRADRGIRAIAGPDALYLRSDVPLHGKNFKTVADFSVAEGQRVSFVLTWYRSYTPTPEPVDPDRGLEVTEQFWRDWSGRCTYQGEWREAVLRSLITLKALIYAPTGGIVAAPTTSLPEQLGGVRNWDYRYCWVRDATFTLYALMATGYHQEAAAWREWLLRAAGLASQLNILYGVTGERRLTEIELDWLPGYEKSRPVRIGNAACKQYQLDIFGEVLDSLHLARDAGLRKGDDGWRVQRELLEGLETKWKEPDEGIWEVRGPRRHFTHSKMMAWVALDRSVKDAETYQLEGPLDRWRQLRDAIHKEVCEKGYNPEVGAFTQYYGSKSHDASLLMMAQVGFLPPTDPRVRGTVEAIEKNLMRGGFVLRYPTEEAKVDGLPPGEGVFLMCTFWLADNYVLLGRFDDARRLYERLLGLCNDVGLLSEEYDPKRKRLLGNFPQAFSHIGLVCTAHNLAGKPGTTHHRQCVNCD
jgi:GH15 family glucan-1,4-alpha-glucosidase